MIIPFGSKHLNPLYVIDIQQRKALIEEALTLPNIMLDSMSSANVVMLGAGYFNPLTGFMSLEESMKVCSDMQTNNGMFWPIPITNRVKDISGLAVGDRVALCDSNIDDNNPIAIMKIKSFAQATEDELLLMGEHIFGTTAINHPGVKQFLTAGQWFLEGTIEVLHFSYFPQQFVDTFQTAYEIRANIEKLGWNKIVAFQTRNPMHRAHEELCKMAIQDLQADGVIIHMLLGKLKQGDIPAEVRDSAIRVMVDKYFEENTVLISGYGFDMLYAGPREALLHAIFRQNMGATHLIVGRDHAGVGEYYGAFEAQDIFDLIPKDALEIQIYKADHTAYSKKLNKVVMMRDVTDHTPEDFVLLSGTRVREMLSQGIAPPAEFSRPEVASVLMDFYLQK